MSFNVVSEVASKNRCIGCGVCTAICPQSVLQMHISPSSNYEVRQIPGCDERCDLCLKVCPFYQKDGFEDALNRKIYADLPNQSGDFAKFLNTYEFYKKDEAQRLSSASGGAGNFIFNALFENGLIDYAICA
ncbi:4Fe-4S binding protein, partial [uncultured Campylobacter sp.]|uniref:4Fe-4S binding protein n=1 Tax=uncultured Campylobacter sp. TaxID=218934 RepID=UPI00260C075C